MRTVHAVDRFQKKLGDLEVEQQTNDEGALHTAGAARLSLQWLLLLDHLKIKYVRKISGTGKGGRLKKN
jgi:hypothetical protein